MQGMHGIPARIHLTSEWHTACSSGCMGTLIESRICFSAADWIAFARIGQMIDDVLDENASNVDLDAPTLIRENQRDTLIDL